MEYYNISYHTYADDTQLFMMVSPLGYSPLCLRSKFTEQTDKYQITDHRADVKFLLVNNEKTEIIVFASGKTD